MTVGLSAVNLADAWLNTMRGGGAGTTFTAPATLFVQLHTGDPLASGTSAVSSNTTRVAITFGASSAVSTTRAIVSSGTAPSWASWSATSPETITHISIWSASSAGTFYCSIALTAQKTMTTGDTLNLTTGSTSISLTPIAA